MTDEPLLQRSSVMLQFIVGLVLTAVGISTLFYAIIWSQQDIRLMILVLFFMVAVLYVKDGIVNLFEGLIGILIRLDEDSGTNG